MERKGKGGENPEKGGENKGREKREGRGGDESGGKKKARVA